MELLQSVVIVLLVSATALAQPKRCCQPEKFITYSGVVEGLYLGETYPLGFNQIIVSAYDFANEQFSHFITEVGDVNDSFRTIYKFKERAMWLIQDQTCIKNTVTQPTPPQCIPSNATYMGASTLSTSTLLSDSWMTFINLTSIGQFGNYSQTVTRDGCYLIGANFMGVEQDEGPSPILISEGRFNITDGIKNPDLWFKLPSFCSSAVTPMDTLDAKSRKMLDIYKRRQPILFQ